VTLELRPYQRAAVDAIYRAFLDGTNAPLIVMPTGSGKAPTLCTFIREALEQWPDQRIVQLVHVRELVSQNLKTMLHIWPDAPVSVYSAGLRSRDLSGQVVFGSIQSLYRKAFELQKVDLVIIDEAHLIPAAGDGMYRKLLSDLAEINGGPVPMCGFTATPFRLSSGSLVEGEGRVFEKIAHEVGLIELIDGGYLCPPVTRATATRIETKGVATRGGEFVAAQLQAAVDREEITEAACDEIVAAGADRRSWLVFSTGIDHAFHIRDALRRRGISCETVTGETPVGERDRVVRAFKNGELRCLTNDSVFTTGFDAPTTDLIAVLRPTQSAGLWIQMVGRGTRTAEGKKDCLILDFGQNAFRHGPLDQIRGHLKKDGGPAPVKECPSCHTIIPAASLECPQCGHEWEIERERAKHSARPDAAPLLSSQVSDWLPVTTVNYHEHRKPGSPPSLRVDYYCGFARYSEWVCFEHQGYACTKAEKWWLGRAVPGVNPCPRGTPYRCEVPDTVDRALFWRSNLEARGQFMTPTAIRIRPDGKFFKIVAVRFDPLPAEAAA
jgi:DNA repair protein RadD